MAKVDEDAASSAQKTLENYFTLKQEEDAIDRELEYYEDDLEFQYRNGSLTRDEYRLKERELRSARLCWTRPRIRWNSCTELTIRKRTQPKTE